jgi:hypothetical protein
LAAQRIGLYRCNADPVRFANTASRSVRSRKDVNASALKKSLTGAFEGNADPSERDATSFDRTLVISVTRPIDAPVGDRLMRTIVTVRPRGGFVFTGYTIAKTEYSVQDIAHIETEDEKSIGVTLAPPIKGFGDNSVDGKYSRKTTSSADITSQYEKLGVDIQPGQLSVVRDSERGTDVQGNTLIELTLAQASGELNVPGFIVTDFDGFKAGEPVSIDKAAFAVKPLRYLRACPILADVKLSYLMRKVVSGREYYTEGKQTVALQPGYVDSVATLLSADESQPALYQIEAMQGGRVQGSLLAQTVRGSSKPIVFDDFSQAKAFAIWIRGKTGKPLGEDGVIVSTGTATIDKGATFRASRISFSCAGSTAN